jgi:hypothetical protein
MSLCVERVADERGTAVQVSLVAILNLFDNDFVVRSFVEESELVRELLNGTVLRDLNQRTVASLSVNVRGSP